MYIVYQLKCLCSHIFLFSDYLFAFFFFFFKIPEWVWGREGAILLTSEARED